MSPDLEPPRLSVGALELLRIAHENDQNHAIVRNAALLATLSFTSRLFSACRTSSAAQVSKLLHVKNPPANFLALVSLSLRRIQAQLDDQFSGSATDTSLPAMTDFNVHVLQAEANVLADFAWPNRSADDFDGPPLSEVMDCLASTEISHAWKVLIQHYVGNILQDIFAAARVRETVRDLDPEAEILLRSQDARMLSEYVFEVATTNDPEDLMRTLERVLQQVIQ
jgi:hypothetical protein